MAAQDTGVAAAQCMAGEWPQITNRVRSGSDVAPDRVRLAVCPQTRDEVLLLYRAYVICQQSAPGLLQAVYCQVSGEAVNGQTGRPPDAL